MPRDLKGRKSDMDYKKNLPLLVGLALFALGGFLGWYSPTINVDMPQNVGASYDPTTFENPIIFADDATFSDQLLAASSTATSFKIGQIGTKHTKVLSGTCNLSTANTASFTASTTILAHCAATGVAAADKCFVAAKGNGTAGVSTMAANGVFLTGLVNATTSDYFGVELINNSGVATTSYTQATSTVAYVCFDN